MNFDNIGEMALGSRLRFLSDHITEDAQKIYDMYHIPLKSKWFPVFYVLSNAPQDKSITAIATAIGHSHPSVIKIIKEMSKAKLVKEQKDKSDKRKTNIVLTKKGLAIAVEIQDQYRDVGNAIKTMLNQTKHNIWHAIQEFEYLLDEKPLLSRVIDEKKKRESASIHIIEYQPVHKEAFKTLNEQWISTYFELEDADRNALENPKTYILDKGGKILMAVQNNTVLGTCALIKMQDDTYDYELAKMAVSPEARGKGIGSLLGHAVINKAKALNAKQLYLESNTILKPAIALYQKLGFKKTSGHHTPYDRCNIQMELQL